MGADAVAVVAATAVAVYEAFAFFSRRVPTVTETINRRPWLLRLGAVLGFAVWALDHFEVWDLL